MTVCVVRRDHLANHVVAIFGLYLESPFTAANTIWYGNKKQAKLEELPELRAFSDILWGFWIRDNPNIKNINFFFMISIINEDSNRIIARCLRNAGTKLGPWPGTSFSTDTDEGHALLGKLLHPSVVLNPIANRQLGSPNGAAFGYFLMQHKLELGPKRISRITIFRDEVDAPNNWVDPNLVFHVDDAPEPPPDDDEETRVLNLGRNRLRVHKI